MSDEENVISETRQKLQLEFDKLEDKQTILRSRDFKALYKKIKLLEKDKRADFGQAVNSLKKEVISWVDKWQDLKSNEELPAIDVTAPFDDNTPQDSKPALLGPAKGSTHPVLTEIALISDIFLRMGFQIEESRQIDDEYHMFDSLNFPKDHPARDEYDTFQTEEGFVLPAHTSNMQNRILLSNDMPIYTVIPGRVFRNENLDATHEHTFHQVEGMVVDKGITMGHMLGTIKEFLSAYFNEEIDFKTQPYYFPFVEPGLEFLIRTPKMVRETIHNEWLEIMGCGMIHPLVLKEGAINPDEFSGFAWGMGVDRLVMLKYGIEDIRLFMSGNLNFLRQFGNSS